MSGQLWSVSNLGGFLSSKNLSSVIRLAAQPMTKFRQFCDVKDASQGGLHRGQSFTWNTFSDVVTAGSALSESSVMPATNFTITQSTLIVTEYGNGVPYAGKLDNLSEQPVRDIIEKVLKMDCVKTLDKMAYDQFASTPLVVAPVGGTDLSAVSLSITGSTTIINNVAFHLGHLKSVIDLMKERNIPAYVGDDYVALGRPATFRALKVDLEGVFKYTESGFGDLLSGQFARYENMRLVEQTNIGNKGWANEASDEIIFLGNDTVSEAVVIAEEIRGKIPGDFGRDMGVAWYYLGGCGLAQKSPAQARVIKWGSAS